jgi:hypothetical protein
MSRLIRNRWFARKVLLEQWFLHADQTAISPPSMRCPSNGLSRRDRIRA